MPTNFVRHLSDAALDDLLNRSCDQMAEFRRNGERVKLERARRFNRALHAEAVRRRPPG